MRDAAVKARRGGAHRSTGVRWWQAVSAVVPITLVASAWGVAITASPGSGSDPINARVADHSGQSGPSTDDVPTDTFNQPTFGKVKKHQSSLVPLAGYTRKQATPTALKSSPLPAAAIGAYRNAAKVMADVKSSCKLDWTLVAAIGRVESDHGQYGGSTIDTTGDSSPEIIGIPLNGSNNTAAISDTDNGQLDGDTTWDRAVGPMQFIPSTWDLVGVDGNGDGVKSPHNVYDAALATAVYLCASEEDLSTKNGASEAVFSYNHSNEYVATVLAIAARYRDGDFTEMPTVYLPDTPDSDDELFDPDSYGPGPSNDGHGDNQGNGSTDDKLKPTTFGPNKNGNGGPHQIQPIEANGSNQSDGPRPNEVGAAGSDGNDNQIKPQVIGNGPTTGKPAETNGTNKPENIDGFIDDKPKDTKPKSGDKPKDDKLGSDLETKPKGPGVDIRPKEFGPKSTDGAQAKPKADTQTKPKADTQTKPKADTQTKPKADTQTKPKVNTQTKPKVSSTPPKDPAEVTEACTEGSEELQAEGTKLTRKQQESLVSDCAANSPVVWQVPGSDPVLAWMTQQATEL